MNSKYKNLLKDTFVFAIGKFGSRIILFVLVPLYTNYLSRSEYGIADLIFTISQLLIPLFSVVIFNGVMRFGLAKDEKKENVLLNAFVVLIGTIIISVLVTPIYSLYSSIAPWRWYLTGIIISASIMDVEMNYLKVCDKNLAYSIISIIQAAVLAGSNIIFLIVFSMGVRGYLLATIISYVSSIILSFFSGRIFADIKKATFDKALLRQMLLFSAPLILNNISWWIIQSSDKLMLERMIDSSALGLYTAATKIPSLINVLISIFHLSWGISSIKEYESSNQLGFYSNIFKGFSFLVFASCIILISVVKPFMSIYVGEEFFEAWHYTPILIASAGFSAMTIFFGTLYGALKKTKNNMTTTVIGAVLNLIVNYFAISYVGIWGALIGTIVSYFVVALLRLIEIHKYLPFEINFYVVALNSLLVVVDAILISMDFHIIIVSLVSLILFVIINMSVINKMVKLTQNMLARRKNKNA